MKKNSTINQTVNIMIKIFVAFIIVYFLYFLGEKTNNFTYDYFIFPILAILVIFICGVKVGRALERMKNSQTKTNTVKNNKDVNTEFVIQERKAIITNKKVISEKYFEDKIHKKVYNYDNLSDKDDVEESE